ncbi:MAG: murein transglycosylase A, partial [Endozoicomonas sp.]
MKPFFCYALCGLTLLVAGCASNRPTVPKQQASFKDLKGWSEHQAEAIKPTLLNSCKQLNPSVLTDKSPWGEYSQWQSLCKELAQTPSRQLKFFFEQNFIPMRVKPDKDSLYTAYYSPVIQGSRTASKDYPVPLLKLPDDLVKVRLSDFGLSGKGLVGRVEDGYLKPYSSRAQINHQNPKPDQVLLWLKNPVEKFFLQVQGSGNIHLKNGELIHVGYAGNNGHDYVSIGKLLKQKGELNEVSMETIQQWLKENPDQREWLLEQNPRYIFFSFSEEGAITSQGVPAMAWRTLAVDPSVIALGMPVWLETTLTATGEPFR